MSEWQYVTSELDFDDAWALAAMFKETRERIQPVSVRVKVVKRGGAFWILQRTEDRTTFRA